MIKGSRLSKTLFLALVFMSASSLAADYQKNEASLHQDSKSTREQAHRQAWKLYWNEQAKNPRNAHMAKIAANAQPRRRATPRKAPKGHQDHPSYPRLIDQPVILLATYRIQGSNFAARIQTKSTINPAIFADPADAHFAAKHFNRTPVTSIKSIADFSQLPASKPTIYGELREVSTPLPYNRGTFLIKQDFTRFQ